MMPVNFPGVNGMISADIDSIKEGEDVIDNIPVLLQLTPEGEPYFILCWMPSKEDKDAIAAGRGIWMRIDSDVMIRVGLLTTDEMGRPNT